MEQLNDLVEDAWTFMVLSAGSIVFLAVFFGALGLVVKGLQRFGRWDVERRKRQEERRSG